MANCQSGCINGLCACSTVATKPLLTVVDQCFTIGECDKTTGQICLDDFAFPVDGKQCIGLEIPKSVIGAENQSLTLFDNGIVIASPAEDLDSNKSYVRGVILKIVYSVEDDNLEEVPLSSKKCFITITNALGEECTYPLYNLFTIFTNPQTVDPQDFINKIVVTNPSTRYSFKVDALLIYTKSATI
jgi:hypothetical protein